jgi:hypothetical protein
MAFTPRELSGTLFKNDRKQNPNHPDYRGTAMINGVEHDIAGWKKEGKRGPFLSLAFKVKETAPPSDRDVEEFA